MKHVILYKLAHPKEPDLFWNQSKGDFDAVGTDFPSEREAKAAAINYIATWVATAPLSEMPTAVEVQVVHRWEQVASTTRIGRCGASDMLARFRSFSHPKGWGGLGPGTTVYETINWLVSRDDWRDWLFMIRVVDEDQDEEVIASLLRQLNVEALFTAPFLFVKHENDALAVKMLMPIAEHIVDLRDPVPDRPMRPLCPTL